MWVAQIFLDLIALMRARSDLPIRAPDHARWAHGWEGHQAYSLCALDLPWLRDPIWQAHQLLNHVVGSPDISKSNQAWLLRVVNKVLLYIT